MGTLSGPPSPNLRLHSDGGTALHWAAIHGDLRTVRSLIGARADVNVQSQGTLRRALWLTGSGPHARTPYMPGQRRTCRASAVLPGRYTALHYAIDRDHRDVVAELLARGADVTTEDWQGCAAICMYIYIYTHTYI